MEGTAMLAEIFMLKAEATAREKSKESITRSTAQFVPIILPAALAKPTSVPSIREERTGNNERARETRLD
jgi:hypothetical protein